MSSCDVSDKDARWHEGRACTPEVRVYAEETRLRRGGAAARDEDARGSSQQACSTHRLRLAAEPRLSRATVAARKQGQSSALSSPLATEPRL